MRLRNCLIKLLITLLVAVGLGFVLIKFFLPTTENIDLSEIDRPADQRILFIGNSYIYTNDLDQMVMHLLQEAVPAWDDIISVRYAPGGYSLQQHLDDTRNETDLRAVLVTGSPTLRDWDLIVIQEQSQMGGLASDYTLNALAGLVDYTQNTAAITMLMMTWGYANGDEAYPDLYPDYLTMQERLAAGYDEMAARVSRTDYPVYVAPVGLGFRAVYQTADNADYFSQLYSPDNSHPSVAGSYLAACIIAASYSGQPMSNLMWRPSGLGADLAAYLRSVADQVVFSQADRAYPWSAENQPQ